MNRRDFLFFTKHRKNTAELSCEQLYMRYLDSTLDGTTSQLFNNVEQGLSDVTFLHVRDAAWLTCEELKPVESILDAFRQRGGRVEYK
jgi:hypothetical protein